MWPPSRARRPPGLRSAVAVVLVALAAAACGGRGGDGRAAGPSTTSTRPPGEASLGPVTLPGSLRVTVSGEVAFRYDRAAALTLTAVAEPAAARRLSFGNVFKPLRLEGRRFFAVAFDLFGTYRGAGTYEIPTTGSASPGTGAPAGGIAPTGHIVVTYADLDVRGPHRGLTFDRVRQPCRLRVSHEARRGSLRCPRLADAAGREIHLALEWAAS